MENVETNERTNLDILATKYLPKKEKMREQENNRV